MSDCLRERVTAVHKSLQQRGILPPGTVPVTEEEEKQDLMYAASLHRKARQKELDAVASRLANMEDSISHMDSRALVLDAGSCERLLSMEASLAALSDSSQGMAERRRTAVQNLKRLSIPYVARDEPEWFFSVPPRLQTIENSMAEILDRFESRFTSLQRSEASRFDRLRTVEASLATSSSSVEDRRRSSVGLVKRGSVTDVSAGDSPLLAKVLGRLQSVEASFASLTNSPDGERAAEDVEERLRAIEASLAAPKPSLLRRRSSLDRIKRTSMASFVRVEGYS